MLMKNISKNLNTHKIMITTSLQKLKRKVMLSQGAALIVMARIFT